MFDDGPFALFAGGVAMFMIAFAIVMVMMVENSISESQKLLEACTGGNAQACELYEERQEN